MRRLTLAIGAAALALLCGCGPAADPAPWTPAAGDRVLIWDRERPYSGVAVETFEGNGGIVSVRPGTAATVVEPADADGLAVVKLTAPRASGETFSGLGSVPAKWLRPDPDADPR
jgi:hypothetical protein